MWADTSSSSLLVKNGNGTGRTIVSPIEVARELNRRFPMTDENNLYFTMTYGVLDLQTLEFRYVLAGHPQPIHVPRDGPPKLLDGNGMAIGWVEDIVCEERIIQLEPGDRIYLYSDGVPEAMNRDHKEFGSRQMLEVIELGKPKSLGDNVSLLLDAVGRWNGNGGFKDDVSILGLEIVGD